MVLAAVVLFWLYLRESRTAAVNSDGAGMALQGWDMLHGNLLLSGWWVADVSFYTFEVPIDALVAGIHGLDADVVHITAAVIYTLLVLTGALLAKGTARGTEGIVRALVGAGIMVAPAFSPGARILLLSPDHTGIGVPILATLLLMDRARERPWVPAAVGVMLTWAQVDDTLATYAAALPLALVCLVRAAVPLAARRRPAWYDAGLAVAALVSVGLAHLVVSAIKDAGGYSMRSLNGVAKIIPFSQWGTQIHASVENVLILFGADFFDQPSGIRTAIAFLHFAGLALAIAGLVIGVAGLVRGADRVTQILTVGIGASLAAGTFGTVAVPITGAHEIAVVLPFGAVLAGRTVGPWLARTLARRRPAITLGPVLGVALAGYLAALGYFASLPPKPAETQGLADFLVAHHLTSGLGTYWSGNNTTLAAGERVRVAATKGSGRLAYTWVTKPAWYEASKSYANFVIATPGKSGSHFAFSESAVRRVFGKPAHIYRDGKYVIMVWNKNLLLQVPKPVQGKKA